MCMNIYVDEYVCYMNFDYEEMYVSLYVFMVYN